MSRSLIYQNITSYRLLMNVLYQGKYQKRFEDVFQFIGPNDKSILELCFADLYLAGLCKEQGKNWTGLDINEQFVARARKNGFEARVCDLKKTGTLPSADVCVMIGSLYHFYSDVGGMLKRMLASAPKVIISEPVVNLSSQPGLIGRLSQRMTNAGSGTEAKRFTEASLIDALNPLTPLLGIEYNIVHRGFRDIIIEIKKCTRSA